jgi:type IV pilus assembly protein PilW
MPGYDSDFHDFVNEEAIEGTDGVTDTIIVRGGRPGQANVESPFEPAGSNKMTITSNGSFGANDIILVARCGANDLLIAAEADLLRVVSNTPNGAKNLQTVTYSIAPGASGQPALFRHEFNQPPQELVEGVEDMQILYGVDNDTDGFPNQYMPANLVADFEEVVAVRVQLLLQSMNDFVADVPQTYTFNGATVTPGDRRIRQVFTSTIALRNRIGSS